MVRGMLDLAEAFACPLVGGNVTRARQTSINITALGGVRPRRILTRSGARPGDRILVTGELGISALERARGRIRSIPSPRVAAGRALARLASVTACIDVSDGLLADLGHLLEASGVGGEIEAHRVPQVNIAWQGGEPTLMGLDFFKKVIELEKKHANGKQIENDLQTNGVLLNDKWCEFLKENNFLVGLSIDGPEELHDMHRRNKGGQPTFKKVFPDKHHFQFEFLFCSPHLPDLPGR